MPCNEIRSQLDRYLDEDLTADERFGIEKHLDVCPDCRTVARSDSDLAKAIAELPDISCPDSVVRRIEEATVGRPAPTRSIGRLREFLTPHRWGVALPAVLASTIVILFLVTNRPERTAEIPPSTTGTQLAEKQARWALSYVVQKIEEDGRQRTGEFVQHDLPVVIRDCLNKAIPDLRGE